MRPPLLNLEPLAERLCQLLAQVPASREPRAPDPPARAAQLGKQAAAQAAMTAGLTALPAGPIGMVLVLPELQRLLAIQQQLVADIAAAHGRSADLRAETMLWCLFQHEAPQSVGQLVVFRDGGAVASPASLALLRPLLQRVALHLAVRVPRAAGKRWLPLVGAALSSGLAYKDTLAVAAAATRLFAGELQWSAVPLVLPATDAPSRAP